MVAEDTAHEGSYLCSKGHELRITLRCRSEDLGDAGDLPFEELTTRHSMVKAFVRERALETAGTDTLGLGATDRPLTVLRHTHHWRGVTWFDASTGVVWLCACATHRSGQSDDAFPYFEDLRRSGRIWPTDDDQFALERDRRSQFSALVTREAPALLASARSAPNHEYVARIGDVKMGILVRSVDTIEETFLALPMGKMLPDEFQLLLVALYPDRPFEDWSCEDRLPTRNLDQTKAEMCFSIVNG